jgi:hypothetical protein
VKIECKTPPTKIGEEIVYYSIFGHVVKGVVVGLIEGGSNPVFRVLFSEDSRGQNGVAPGTSETWQWNKRMRRLREDGGV